MAIRVGVIGTGAIGQDHIRRFSETLSGARVTVVSDIDAARTKAVADKYGARVEANGLDLIKAKDVDAVVVTSWGPTHAEFVLAAIAAGKPVFCEKPLATNAADAKKVIDAEVKFGKKLVQVGFMRRYDAGYIMLKEAVTSGTIGTPLMIHAAHRNPRVGESYITEMAIHDTAIHEIDCLRWLLDDDYVSAQVLKPRSTKNTHAKLVDPQIVLLETASGMRIDLEVFVNCQYGYDIQCEIVGEKGIARLPEPMQLDLLLDSKRSTRILTEWKDRFIGAYDVELQDWINATAAGKQTGPTSWDGYSAAVTADACVAAQKISGTVPIKLGKRPALYA